MPAQRCSPLAGEVRVTDRHERGLTTSMLVDRDEAIFAGHYPGFPIFPGVCLVECAMQSVIAAADERGAAIDVQAVESTRFLAPVYPGDTVVTRVETDDGETWRCALDTERGPAASVRLLVRPR
jgi:3-hydroxyacyl-[acyl-carrier-protein] dehydratase